MKIKWSLDINTGAVERSEAARARSLAGATVGGAKYPSIFGVGVPNTLGYLEWGCKISGGAKYPVTPGNTPHPVPVPPGQSRSNAHQEDYLRCLERLPFCRPQGG